MSGKYKVVLVEKEEDYSGCAATLAGIVIVVFIVAVIFLLSPLVVGIWLLVSLFTTGWNKDTKILTAVWVVLSLIVPSVYYMEWLSFFNENLPWLDDIIWMYYAFAGLGIAATLFWGVYRIGIALLSNPNENFQNGDGNTKILVGGIAVVLALCCVCSSLLGFIFYINN
ncbi:MAG: hypothetical protein IT310_13570 [Anaerolineales bacterium]|nr:hypothetical protein [Anaerolineales bacterium]